MIDWRLAVEDEEAHNGQGELEPFKGFVLGGGVLVGSRGSRWATWSRSWGRMLG